MVPDIVYSLERYDKEHRLVENLVRDEPFANLGPADDDAEASDQDGQKPVLQIVTRVFQDRPRGRRGYSTATKTRVRPS
ncbi:hypothetical protein CDD83_1618 [Cordyceps sp. RAO-2017]|nr:hypothetical protein CDD83_1618 [Cordyceps sp. RAO-2017]